MCGSVHTYVQTGACSVRTHAQTDACNDRQHDIYNTRRGATQQRSKKKFLNNLSSALQV